MATSRGGRAGGRRVPVPLLAAAAGSGGVDPSRPAASSPPPVRWWELIYRQLLLSMEVAASPRSSSLSPPPNRTVKALHSLCSGTRAQNSSLSLSVPVSKASGANGSASVLRVLVSGWGPPEGVVWCVLHVVRTCVRRVAGVF